MKRYAGSLASAAASNAIRTVTGYGAYSGMRGGMQGKTIPKIRNAGQNDGSVVISNEEYLGDIKSSVTAGKFLNTYVKLNPGNKAAFPWLGSIAENFQEYRWEGLCFTFKSMSGNALTSTDTSLGSVILSTNYDPVQSPPSTKAEMENMEFANSGKPSQTIKHFIECAKSQTPLTNLYVASQKLAPQGDQRFYNFGTFNIATQGLQGSQVNVGELWVSYQVRLFKPQLWDALGKDVDYFAYSGSYSQCLCTNTNPLGTLDLQNPEKYTTIVYPGITMKPILNTGFGMVFAQTAVPKTFKLDMLWRNINGLSFAPGAMIYRNCEEVNGLSAGINSNMIANPETGESNNLWVALTTYIYTGGGNMQTNWGFEWDPLTTKTIVSNDPTGRFSFSIVEIPNLQA